MVAAWLCDGMGWAYVTGMDFTYSVWILRTRHGFYVIGMILLYFTFYVM